MLATFLIRMSCWRHFWFECHVGDTPYPVTNILPVEVGCCAANATDVSLWVMEDVTMDSYIAAVDPCWRRCMWSDQPPSQIINIGGTQLRPQYSALQLLREIGPCALLSRVVSEQRISREFAPDNLYHEKIFFAICSQGFKFQLGHWCHNTSVSSKLMSDNQVWTPNMYIIQLRCVFHWWFSCYLMILITLLNIYWDIRIIRYAKFALITCERLALQNLIHFDYDFVVVWLNIVNCILPS